MKKYQKPEAEFVLLEAVEKITDDTEVGEVSNPFGGVVGGDDDDD